MRDSLFVVVADECNAFHRLIRPLVPRQHTAMLAAGRKTCKGAEGGATPLVSFAH